MYSKVKQVRRAGVVRSDQDLANDAGVTGALSLTKTTGIRCLTLQPWDNSRHDANALPPLWEAQLVAWVGDAMVFRGWQQPGPDGGPTYLQEWRVQVVGMHPPG